MSTHVKVGVAVAAIAVAAAAFLLGPRPDKSTTASSAAVAASGATTVDVGDPVHDRPFTVSTWAPTGSDQHTLIVISHGFAGDRTSHDDLAANLASYGFTVAAPTHPDVAGLESADPALDPLVLRPRHLSLTIDYMIDAADAPFERVIVVGHSLGGYSALRIAGANPSGADVDEYCQANPADNTLCTPVARERIDQLVSDQADLADGRVDAIVLLAPAYGPLFSDSDLVSVEATALVISATNDEQVPGDQIESLLAALPSETASVAVDGGHFVFRRPCTDEERSAVAYLCVDNDATRAAAHETVTTAIDQLLAN